MRKNIILFLTDFKLNATHIFYIIELLFSINAYYNGHRISVIFLVYVFLVKNQEDVNLLIKIMQQQNKLIF